MLGRSIAIVVFLRKTVVVCCLYINDCQLGIYKWRVGGRTIRKLPIGYSITTGVDDVLPGGVLVRLD